MKRILVTYATRTGTTTGVAEAIGKALAARGMQVDVRPIAEDPDPAGYDAVVVGSAVNGGKWLPAAVDYVTRRRTALEERPVAAFCVHIMNTGADEKARRKRAAYLDNVRPLIHPCSEAFFAGQANLAGQGAIARWAFRAFKIGPEGDNRDWDAIRAWAESLFLKPNK